jgi:predicted enzyme related to lactoylglutathione lyase
MTIADVALVSIPVSDPERAVRFYRDALGFDVVRDDRSVPGMRWLQLAPAGAGSQLTLATWFETMPPGSLRGLVFSCDDVEGEHARLVAAGADSVEPPARKPWGLEAVVCDPDGNELVLSQRP